MSNGTALPPEPVHPLEEQMRLIDSRKADANSPDGVLTYGPAQHDAFIRHGVNVWAMNDMMRAALSGVHMGVKCTWVAADQIQVTADKLSVEGVVFESLDLTGDIDTNLDTGSVAVDTWYSYWVISSSRGEQSKIWFSLSATNPALPAGFVLKRREGYALTDAAGDFYRFDNAKGSDWFMWNEDESVAPFKVLDVDPSVTSPADVDFSPAAAPSADELRIEGKISSAASSEKHLHLRRNGLSNITDPNFILLSGQIIAQTGNIECDSAQIVEYWTNNTTFAVRLRALGYRDSR